MSILIRKVNSEVDEFVSKVIEVFISVAGRGSEEDIEELHSQLKRFLEATN